VLRGLFAFMLAVVHAPEEAAVDMKFRLLREWPVALQHSGSSVEIKDSQKHVDDSLEKKFNVKG
jgi:hypothetical protein